MRIAVFKFEVCNHSSCPCDGDEKYSWYHTGLNRLMSPDDIEYEINHFCEDKEERTRLQGECLGKASLTINNDVKLACDIISLRKCEKGDAAAGND